RVLREVLPLARESPGLQMCSAVPWSGVVGKRGPLMAAHAVEAFAAPNLASPVTVDLRGKLLFVSHHTPAHQPSTAARRSAPNRPPNPASKGPLSHRSPPVADR